MGEREKYKRNKKPSKRGLKFKNNI